MSQTTLEVSISFMGEMVSIVGERHLTVTLPEGATVGDLLNSLSQRDGNDFRSRVFSGPTNWHHTILIFVDGENIRDRGGLAA